jgi:hypothetical protein
MLTSVELIREDGFVVRCWDASSPNSKEFSTGIRDVHPNTTRDQCVNMAKMTAEMEESPGRMGLAACTALL